MPFFDGTGPGNGRFGKGKGPCYTGSSRNGKGFLSILWNIGKFLVYSGIAGATYKKITSIKNVTKIKNDERNKLNDVKNDNLNIIDAEWKEIKK